MRVTYVITLLLFCGMPVFPAGIPFYSIEEVKTAPATNYYHIRLSADAVDAESAVAVKNGYALGIALTIGVSQRRHGADSELHFNSQAAVFGQSVREMHRLLQLQGAATLANPALGAGDLYVTVYGGRTRLVGILPGRGLDIDEAKDKLRGVTLESLVVAQRVTRALRVKIGKGLAKKENFSLLTHIDEILTKKAAVSIPWEDFAV